MTIWEFRVKPGREPEFERVYRSEGEWAQLFRRGEGFIRTELFTDIEIEGRYITIDHWTSEELYDSFRRQNEDDYAALDLRCEALTQSEKHLGSFLS